MPIHSLSLYLLPQEHWTKWLVQRRYLSTESMALILAAHRFEESSPLTTSQGGACSQRGLAAKTSLVR
jgi:hypothetical protein